MDSAWKIAGIFVILLEIVLISYLVVRSVGALLRV